VPVVETECRPDLAMPAGVVCSAEARSSPVPGLRVDAAAARAVQSAEERPAMAMPTGPGRSKVVRCATVHKHKKPRRVKPVVLNLPSSGCGPRVRLDRSKQAAP
jgi:hypothetical protein